MITVAEHSVDLDCLHGKQVLDLGCRGFEFTRQMRELGLTVFPVDLDILHEDMAYYRCAISNYNGRCGVHRPADKQATCITTGDEVNCMTLESFSQMVGVAHWDLIKMDIESAEYEIIMSWKTPPCDQLSIEFHLH